MSGLDPTSAKEVSEDRNPPELSTTYSGPDPAKRRIPNRISKPTFSRKLPEKHKSTGSPLGGLGPKNKLEALSPTGKLPGRNREAGRLERRSGRRGGADQKKQRRKAAGSGKDPSPGAPTNGAGSKPTKRHESKKARARGRAGWNRRSAGSKPTNAPRAGKLGHEVCGRNRVQRGFASSSDPLGQAHIGHLRGHNTKGGLKSQA